MADVCFSAIAFCFCAYCFVTSFFFVSVFFFFSFFFCVKWVGKMNFLTIFYKKPKNWFKLNKGILFSVYARWAICFLCFFFFFFGDAELFGFSKDKDWGGYT